MEQRAAETLAGLSVRTVKSVRQKVASLSGGQRQTVAIARAVLWNSKLVILDEPTAALGVAQTEQVLRLVRRLADRGLAVILISHNMNDVLAVADDIAVLYLGRLTAQVEAKDVTHTEVVQLITGGDARQGGRQGRGDRPARRRPDPIRTPAATAERDGSAVMTHHRGRRGARRRPAGTARHGLGDSAREYVARIRGGDVGPLPAILGLVVLLIVFSVAAAGHVHQLVQLRQPADPERTGHRDRDGPGVRPADRRDRPVRGLHRRRRRRRCSASSPPGTTGRGGSACSSAWRPARSSGS